MLCKTCKFWSRKIELELDKDDIKEFKNIIIKVEKVDDTHFNQKIVIIPNSPFGECSNENFIYSRGCIEDELRVALKNNKSLMYSDGEACGAYFYTCEEFGCIHHEEN